VRGNVGTRLGKLDAGEYDALVLASAGLHRLGLSGRVAEYLDVQRSVPAAGQGALGIECLAAVESVRALLAVLDDPLVRRCVEAERAVSAGLGADCSAPLGAHATLQGDQVQLNAVLASVDGRRVLRASARGSDPVVVGGRVVADLRRQGAADILAALDGA
jgi:hydroxymethylbilane synthase